MKYLLFIAFLLQGIAAYSQVDTTQQIVPGRKNSVAQQKKPYVILISADGFRYDYAEQYKTEHLIALAASGVKAEYLIPSFPTLTFPNHYAMVTGLTPAHSGLVANNFYDPARKETYFNHNKKNAADSSWYNGTPLWTLAEQQNMISATFYWVGSDAGRRNGSPTYFYKYNEKIDINSRINTVMNWLKLPAEDRPHFITFYLPQVDQAGHRNNPDSPETGKAVKFIDSAVYELTKAVKTTGLDVNFIFVSDHGMVATNNKNPLPLVSIIDTAKYMAYGDVPVASLYAKKGADLTADYKELKRKAKGKGFDVYLKSNMPKRFGYGTGDDRYNRIGDIILVAKSPLVFQFGNYNINPGQHGYDVKEVPEMRAVFYAWGPAFKKSITVKPFKNVDVYNIVSTILGLKMPKDIDGNDKTPQKVLQKR